MLWSLREHVHINIGYKNGLPHQTTAATLQSMWTQGGEEDHRLIIRILLIYEKTSKKQTYECKAFAAPLQIAFSINTLADNPQVHPEHFCH